MSIASEISRLQTAKANLKTAIEGKGVTVPSATTLDGYAELVDSISGGSSQIGDFTKYKSVSVTPTVETYALLTNPMDVTPKLVIISAAESSHARATANYMQDIVLYFDLLGAAGYNDTNSNFIVGSLKRSTTPNANGLFGFMSSQPTKIIIYRVSGTVVWSTQTEYKFDFYA